MLANQVSQANIILQHGGVIAYSTETILGLGCDPKNENSVNRLLWLKNRAIVEGFILLVNNSQAMRSYTQTLSATQISKIESAQNTTWLIPPHTSIPKWITGKHQSLAVRITKHPIAQQLSAAMDGIVSTSANMSGYKALCTIKEIKNWFGPHLDYVIIGEPGTGLPSSICDLLTGKKLR